MDIKPILRAHAGPPTAEFAAVVVAASLGGPDALGAVLGGLPHGFAVPILVAQHIRAGSPGYLPRMLQRQTTLAVRHAAAGERPQAGTVYVAPPGHYLLLDARGRCALSDGPRVSFARPAADVLFTSAARVFGAQTIGVVLTGRLFDGAAGAAAIRHAGGVVLAQDPATCRAPGMPRAAIRRGAAHLVLSPTALAAALIRLVAEPGGAAEFARAPRPASQIAS